METVAQFVQNQFGGEITKHSTYEYSIDETRFGKFKLEVDAQLIKDKRYQEVLSSFGVDISSWKMKDKIEDTILNLASGVVPLELISPPIPLSQLNEIDTLIEKLRKEEIEGTEDSPFYAFGMHINPEAPSFESTDILAHLQSFILLDSWIRADININWSRRITPYIEKFDELYAHLALDDDYTPDVSVLINDFFNHKNDRNRALDLLPLFTHLNPDLVHNYLDDGLTQARPTYHYRLPNCSFNDPEWSVAKEWNRWILVEKLANDDRMRRFLNHTFLIISSSPVEWSKKRWNKIIQWWIDDITSS
jgi:hypothetical protein